LGEEEYKKEKYYKEKDRKSMRKEIDTKSITFY